MYYTYTDAEKWLLRNYHTLNLKSMKLILSVCALAGLIFCIPAAAQPEPPASVQEYAAVTAVQRSVVKILTLRGKDVGEGSGFFAGQPGQLITNVHVVDGATHCLVFVSSPDSSRVEIRQAKVERMDPQNDLAVLRVAGDNLPPAIPVAGADAMLMQDVVSIGYPGDIDEDYAKSIIARRLRPGSAFTEPPVLAYLLPHYTKGHIAKIVPGRLYHTAAIDRGNSGGPLVNKAGEIVGINRSATSDPFYPFYFAIPVQHLRALLAR